MPKFIPAPTGGVYAIHPNGALVAIPLVPVTVNGREELGLKPGFRAASADDIAKASAK